MADTGENSGSGKRVAILVVLVIALAAAVAYNFYDRGKHTARAQRNSPFNLVLTWRCLACGHELQDKAGVGPRVCPACGQAELYVCIPHACPQHGEFPVAFQYGADGVATEVKVADGPWVPRLTDDGINIHCPRCGAILLPVKRQPEPTPD